MCGVGGPALSGYLAKRKRAFKSLRPDHLGLSSSGLGHRSYTGRINTPADPTTPAR